MVCFCTQFRTNYRTNIAGYAGCVKLKIGFTICLRIHIFFIMYKCAIGLMFTLACAALSSLCGVEKYALENELLKFEIDENGRLSSLKNKATGAEYAGGGDLWRIIYSRGDSLENEWLPSDAPIKLSKPSAEKILLEYGGQFPVKIECWLDGAQVLLKPTVKNASSDLILREFQFPLVKNLPGAESSRLIWSMSGGAYAARGGQSLRDWVEGAKTGYMAEDYDAVERSGLYPGRLALNCFFIEDKDSKNALYAASYDGSFQKTLHLFRGRSAKAKVPREIDVGFVKYPFLKPGESESYSASALAPVSSWADGAKLYRKWADSWYRPFKPADSVRSSNGWQRLIARHQYGKQFFKYSDFPKILKDGLAADIDTLFLFGWFKEGHDAGYPHYSPETEQGGDAALKKAISEFQKGGGKVIIYYNGQLIDAASDFYKKLGRKISVKVPGGSEHIERYMFGGAGTALRTFGNKTFVTACFGCPEWLEVLKKLADRALDMGADGVFFDQLGFMSQACWDESHGHEVPFMKIMGAKRKVLEKLRDHIKSRNPQASFGIEWLSDCTSEYADYVHNVYVYTKPSFKDKYGVLRTDYVPLYMYIFPETVTTDREIRDDTDVKRRVNLAVIRGWRSDVEIYRCRATVAEAPNYQAYLKEVGTLRDKYRRLILNGTFRGTDLVECVNPRVEYSVFTAGSELAVVVSQSSADSEKAGFKVPGFEFAEGGGVGGAQIRGNGDCAEASLPKDSLAVLVFKRNE